MIEFRPIRLEDRPVIERYTMPSGICNCDLAFANMFCWQSVYHSAWAEIDGFLVIRFHIDGGERIGYMQPVGKGDFGPIAPLLREDAHAHGQRLRIIGLTDEGCETIRRMLASGGTTAYTIEKQGVRKMIYQTAWRERGEIRGLVEISMELPDEMPHYIRK